jgi:DNA-binding LytR/AlgR family response regulator
VKVVVLEDEPPALARILKALKGAGGVDVEATFGSVAEARGFFADRSTELVVSDIELSDGSALPLFASGHVQCPVIFATAYDRYLVDAFQSQAIDYLLKPIDDGTVARALEKYRRLAAHFERQRVRNVLDLVHTPRRRVIARKAGAQVALPVDDVAYFRANDKLTLAVLGDGSELIVDRTLGEIERELDAATFFRVNRAFLAHVNAIRSWRSAGKGRIVVVLAPRTPDDVFISQENAGAFRAFVDR